MQFLKVASLFGLFAIAACGGTDIRKICDEGCDRTCDGATPLTADEKATCKQGCATFESRVEATDCKDQAEKLADCGDENACDPAVNSKCSDETAALSRCFSSFCSSHPNDNACTSGNGS